MGVVQSAINLVENDISDVLNWADYLYHLATNAINWGFAVLNTALGDLQSWAQSAIGYAVNWATYLYHQAVGYANWLYSQAIQAAQAYIRDTVSWANGLIRYVEREALSWANTAIRFASVAVSDAEQLARKLTGDAISYLGHVISAGLADLYKTLLRDYINPILDVVKWLKKAWGWIVWLAEHPFDLVHDIETDVINWADHLPEDLAQVAEGRAFARGVDAMGKFLGG